jgi:hypothetical protein
MKIQQKNQKEFKLEISPVKEEKDQKNVEEDKQEESEGEQEKQIIYEPKTRAPGGIWLQAADFPFCFQYFIIFHNNEKLANKKRHRDVWTDPSIPYKANEDGLYVRLREPTEEEKKADEEANPEPQVDDENDPYKISEDIPKDKKKRVLVAFAPNPTSKAAEKLPRYYCRIQKFQDQEAEEDTKEDNNIVLTNLSQEEKEGDEDSFLFSHYFSGQTLVLDEKVKFILKPHIYAPLGYCLWLASDHKIDILTYNQY